MQHFGKSTTLLSKVQVILLYTLLCEYFVIIVDIFNEEEAECEHAPSANHLELREELDEFDLVYGRKLRSPILGYNCQLPDLPTSCVPSTILDTSLLHVRFNSIHFVATEIFPFYPYTFDNFSIRLLTIIYH